MLSCILQAVMPSVADDYTLGIFGNANMDDTIDELDIEFVQEIIDGTNDETELADANRDSKIDKEDIVQIERIIEGDQEVLHILDGNGEPVAVNTPAQRIIVLYKDSPEVLRTLNAADRIVGVSDYIKQWDTVWFPEISQLQSVGHFINPDYEKILSLNADVLLAFGSTRVDEMQKQLPGVTVLFLGLYNPDLINAEQSRYKDGVKKLGYILDKREEAEEFLNWRDYWLNTIKSRTNGLSEDEKPLVMNTHYRPAKELQISCTGYKTYQMTSLAGARDIAENAYNCDTYTNVNLEWLLTQNPEIIIAQLYYEDTNHGFNTDDPSETALGRDDIMNISVLANCSAVKNGQVFMIADNFRNGGDGCLIGTAYLAKWFHPELFEDLDPQAIHQEYITRFQHQDYDLDEHGVFVYPPLNEK
jgi:iron complex transport system substrate-binding protein